MTLTFDRPGQLGERPATDWTRDDAGRPRVLPDPTWTPETAPPGWVRDGVILPGRDYTRVTTFGEALLDGTMLARWKMRRVALGMGRRPDYVVAAAALTAEDRDKAALNDLAEKALEAAGPNAADVGTALHGFSERIDRGEPLGVVPPEYRDGLERYRELVQAHLTWRHREERMVCDALEVAGTPDGIALCDQPDPDGVVDLWRIVDLKTGNIETTAGKFSTQLGIYSHSALYDAATGRRTWLADLDTRWGLVLHMPAGIGTAELRWLNLQHGWLGAQVAGPVRRWRTVNHADLLRPLVPQEREVAAGKCRGLKRDGKPCTYAAKQDGLCTRHQGQDPDAVVPVRVQEVAADISAALESVPPELAAQPLPDRDVADAWDQMAGGSQEEADAAEELADEDDENTPDPAGRNDTQLDVDVVILSDEVAALVPELFEGMTEPQPYSGPQTVADQPIGMRQGPIELPAGHHQLPLTDPRRQPVELNGNPRPHTSMPDPEAAREADQNAELALLDQIRACRTTGEMDLLWEATGHAWSTAVKGYAKRHRDLLPQRAQEERRGAALLAAINAAEDRMELRQLFTDPRNLSLITDEHKAAAKARAADLPMF